MSHNETPFRSGPFREHKEVVEKKAGELYEEFIQPEKFDGNVKRMFALDDVELALLTEQDKKDVKNFARYAFKRLAASSLFSPLHQGLVESGKVEKVIDTGTSGKSHDLVHAIVAYARSNGKSLTPAYNKVIDREELHRGGETRGEEMFVDLFEHYDYWKPQGKFLYFARGGDPFLDFQDWYRVSSIWDKEEARQRLSEHVQFAQSDPPEYLARMHEELQRCAAWGAESAGAGHMRSIKDPAYYHFLKTICDYARSDNPDPLVRFKEFQHITGPLLEKLRKTKQD